MRLKLATGACAVCMVLADPAWAADQPPASGDLSNLSIEQLANIQVRSASKREEPLSTVAAALYVITEDDIESNGLTTLPEALRLAPNLSVQQVDASNYSISARGFNGLQASNKVLALIDGRSIYTPLASGVIWNLRYPIVEDLQQIEVISGPGGTLFGPNAVNGVINITSKDAQDTLGALARGTAGAGEQSAAARYGFALGGAGAMRFYANWQNLEELPRGLGAESDDDYRGWRTGFRSDFITEADHLTLQGDLFRTKADTFPGDGAKGHNLLARWSRALGPASSFQLQAFYDRFERRFTLVDDSLTTLDADGQFNATVGRHDVVAGAGARRTRDEFINELNLFQLVPPRRTLWVYNGFLQDRWRISDELALIAGVKIERSTFTGWQVLPNLRLAWQPSDRNLLWAAVSRAVRTPSRIDRQLEARPLLIPAPDFDSEKLIALEAGYRGQPSSKISLSINGFVNFYDDLRTSELVGANFQLRNGTKGKTYGVEAWGNAQMAPWWRISIGAATLWKDFHDKEGHHELIPRNSLGNDPHWQVVGRSEFDVANRIQLSLNARAVGRIKQDPEVGSYVEAGGQVSYQATREIELFVAGRNLIHRTHEESNDPGAAQLAKRSVYAGARARF